MAHRQDIFELTYLHVNEAIGPREAAFPFRCCFPTLSPHTAAVASRSYPLHSLKAQDLACDLWAPGRNLPATASLGTTFSLVCGLYYVYIAVVEFDED